MTEDPTTLLLLLERAEAVRDEAVAERVKLEAARRAADVQAEQLVTYRREYEARWQAEFCRSGQIELVRCYQGFMTRLSQAVEQQQQLAANTALQLERATVIARGHDIRARALARLVERRRRDGALLGARREQQQSDEHATRAAWADRAAAITAGST